MKDEEKTPSQVGLRGVSDVGNKVMRVFTKLKRKAEQVETKFQPMPQSSAQVTP